MYLQMNKSFMISHIDLQLIESLIKSIASQQLLDMIKYTVTFMVI